MRIASVSGSSASLSISRWNAASTVTLRLRQLRAAGLLRERVDAVAELLDRGVSRRRAPDRLFFGHFLGAGFDHDDAVVAAGDDEIEAALLALLRSVGLMTYCAVDEADAHAGDRLLERHLGERQRRRGAGDGEHVAQSLSVSAESTNAMICVS